MNYNLTISSLQDDGYRITKVRRKIVEIFSKASKPISSGEVANILKKSGILANRTTIYRELQFMHSNGYLKQVFLFPKKVHYESSDLKHHHHLICDSCGKIDKVTKCLANDFGKSVYNRKGFRIDRHNLEFYGICSNCAKTN